VWMRRIDPARGRIINVPQPEVDRRYGDLVLHDGEPRGERMFHGRPRPVFDELAVLERSEFGTWEIALEAPAPADVDAIVALFEDVEVVVEDWTAPASVEGAWLPERRLGVAARHERELRRLRRLGRWRSGIRTVERVL